MKFNSLRTSLVGSAFALLAAVLLGSCGGGGAATTLEGGALRLFPESGTVFAGVPATLTITGGRTPYTVVSSEPGVLPVPHTVNQATFDVIPNNPGVIDTGIPDGGLPVRTVNISVSDTTGLFTTSAIRVAQNFLTGYGVFYSSNCTGSGTGAAPGACAGGETNIRLEANFNGNLVGNRIFRLEILRGPFFWVFPNGTIAGNIITVQTDHEGKANAIFRVTNNVQTQIGVYRIIDVETGASPEQVFIIDGTDLTADLTVIPDQFTFTGPFDNTCGTGSADFLVFDGIPPYTAVSSFGQVSVSPTTTDTQPGRFTFTVGNPNVCLTDATIVITDSNNARGTVTITTEAGSNAPPPPALRVSPTTVTATCGASASAAVVGGTGTYSVFDVIAASNCAGVILKSDSSVVFTEIVFPSASFTISM